MGCIKEINDLDMTISLPNCMTGFVAITDISEWITQQVQEAAGGDDEDEDDEMQDLDMPDTQEAEVPDLKTRFKLGQMLPCCVTQLQGTKGKRRIELSLNPQLVNASLSLESICKGMTLAGSIKSVEDHGYMIDLGLEDTLGFLNKKHCKTYLENNELALGQVLMFQVLKKDAKAVTLCLDPVQDLKKVVRTWSL